MLNFSSCFYPGKTGTRALVSKSTHFTFLHFFIYTLHPFPWGQWRLKSAKCFSFSRTNEEIKKWQARGEFEQTQVANFIYIFPRVLMGDWLDHVLWWNIMDRVIDHFFFTSFHDCNNGKPYSRELKKEKDWPFEMEQVKKKAFLSSNLSASVDFPVCTSP